ncbi:MAG: hypothetical protein SX243_09295 [Acidobacteriota bacterium]|nr:hypothetical protein [Acidobacteriota bacterium]
MAELTTTTCSSHGVIDAYSLAGSSHRLAFAFNGFGLLAFTTILAADTGFTTLLTALAALIISDGDRVMRIDLETTAIVEVVGEVMSVSLAVVRVLLGDDSGGH